MDHSLQEPTSLPASAITPRISAIIVVRNGEAYLAHAIESVLAQTVTADEIIVVDGQSVDGTASVARRYLQVCYVLQPDLGLANARNLGIDRASGDLVAFLDHDDSWLPDKLERQRDLMVADPVLRYSTTQMRFVWDHTLGIHANLRRDALDAPRAGSTPSALMAWRALFAEIGYFDPAYTIGCDADWFTRARDCRVPTAVCPDVLLHKRLHLTNLSTQAATNRREMLQIAARSIARTRQMDL